MFDRDPATGRQGSMTGIQQRDARDPWRRLQDHQNWQPNHQMREGAIVRLETW